MTDQRVGMSSTAPMLRSSLHQRPRLVGQGSQTEASDIAARLRSNAIDSANNAVAEPDLRISKPLSRESCCATDNCLRRHILQQNNGSLLGALWDVAKTVAPDIAAAYGARGGTNITGRINMGNTAEAEGAESESNQLLRLPNGDIRFRGMVVQVQEDLTHLTIQELDDMVETGASPLTEDGKVVTLHHVGQNPSGPLWEIAAPLNDVHNKELHPFGNAPGAGLTPAQRADFNNWRNEYWQSRASEELARRRLEQTGGQQ